MRSSTPSRLGQKSDRQPAKRSILPDWARPVLNEAVRADVRPQRLKPPWI